MTVTVTLRVESRGRGRNNCNPTRGVWNTITISSIVGLMTRMSGQKVSKKGAPLKVKLEWKWGIRR